MPRIHESKNEFVAPPVSPPMVRQYTLDKHADGIEKYKESYERNPSKKYEFYNAVMKLRKNFKL